MQGSQNRQELYTDKLSPSTGARNYCLSACNVEIRTRICFHVAALLCSTLRLDNIDEAGHGLEVFVPSDSWSWDAASPLEAKPHAFKFSSAS